MLASSLPLGSDAPQSKRKPRSWSWPLIRTLDDKSSVAEPSVPKKGFKGEAYSRKLQGVYDEVADRFYASTVGAHNSLAIAHCTRYAFPRTLV